MILENDAGDLDRLNRGNGARFEERRERRQYRRRSGGRMKRRQADRTQISARADPRLHLVARTAGTVKVCRPGKLNEHQQHRGKQSQG